MLFVDLHVYTGETSKSMDEVMLKFSSNINYSFYLNKDIQHVFIQHAGIKAEFKRENTRFIFRKGNNKKGFYNFLTLFLEVRKMKPDVVMMHGMIDPLTLLFAKFIFRRNVKMMIQNHAELPFKSLKRYLQKYTAKHIDAFLFVSKEQAEPWIKAGIVRTKDKVFEVMEGSTGFKFRNKAEARKKLSYNDGPLFLWVGRLDKNKDPLTILNAFGHFVKTNKNAHLIMIYGSNLLEKEVKEFIRTNNLSHCISLLGEMEHSRLEVYYNATDYFILGSHYEGSGYALCEAMACGCVPIVSKIPSFEKMSDFGDCAYLFEAGNSEELLSVLNDLNEEALQIYKNKVLKKFKEDLSFEAIAKKIEKIIYLLGQK